MPNTELSAYHLAEATRMLAQSRHALPDPQATAFVATLMHHGHEPRHARAATVAANAELRRRTPAINPFTLQATLSPGSSLLEIFQTTLLLHLGAPAPDNAPKDAATPLPTRPPSPRQPATSIPQQREGNPVSPGPTGHPAIRGSRQERATRTRPKPPPTAHGSRRHT